MILILILVTGRALGRPGTPPRPPTPRPPPTEETYHPPVPRYIYHPPPPTAAGDAPTAASDAPTGAAPATGAASGPAADLPPAPAVEIASGPPRWGYLFYLFPGLLIVLVLWLRARRKP
jgi:hypothetical protein